MTLQNRTALTTTIETNIPVGTSGGVTATNHRQVEENLADGIWKRVATEIDDGDSPYTASVTTTQILLADPTSGAITVNLPEVDSSSGAIITIKNIGTSNAVTIDADGSETIDGATTLSLSSQWDFATLFCNGDAWFVIAS
jgi:hypothetical protein